MIIVTLPAHFSIFTVSADPKTRDECRSFALSQSDKVDFFESEFQPSGLTGGFWAPKDEVPYVA